MKTSQSIEQSEERKKQGKEPLTGTEVRKYGRGRHPHSHTPRGFTNHGPDRNPKIRPTKWLPGESGNPSGRISDKRDIARQIARAVFENNREQLYDLNDKARMVNRPLIQHPKQGRVTARVCRWTTMPHGCMVFNGLGSKRSSCDEVCS
jgi:hypothetical protein